MGSDCNMCNRLFPAGLPGNPASLFAGRELGPGCLPGTAQDPWGRLHAGRGPFPPPMAADRQGGAWGGLKAEADRERLEHESEKQRRLEAEKERKEREAAAIEKAKEMEREKKAHEERQRERDRENRLHLHHSLTDGILRNGDYLEGRGSNSHPMVRDREPHSRPPPEWGMREAPTRSPARMPKSEGPFEAPMGMPKAEVRVKEERRDEEPDRKKPAPPPAPPDPTTDYRVAASHFLGLAPERAFWAGPLAPPTAAGADPYRLLDLHARSRELDREIQRYRLLGSPMVPLHDRFPDAAPTELERFALERELHSKLAPPPLRAGDSAGAGFPGAQALFPPLAPPNPYLSNLTSLAAASSRASKNGASPVGPRGGPEGAVPPPLIPCSSGPGPNSGVGPHGVSPLNHKIGSLVEHNSHEVAALYAKERRELANHKADTQLR